MAILPLIFLIQPLIAVFALPASAAAALSHEHLLLYMLGIPAIVPASLAAYSVVGERQQGTLEPVLTTPIRREEFLLGKALAALVPSRCRLVRGLRLVPRLRRALRRIRPWRRRSSEARTCSPSCSSPRSLPAGRSGSAIAISARSSDLRVAQQLGMLASLPSVAVTTLIAFDVIHATLGLALGLAAALLLARRTRLADRVGDVRPRTAHHGNQIVRRRRAAPARCRLRGGPGPSAWQRLAGGDLAGHVGELSA